MRGTWKKVLAGLVLFVSGLVVGVFGARLWVERGTLALLHGDSKRFAEIVVRRLSGDLDLTSEQRAKLLPIVMETAKRLAEIRREQEPKIQAAMEADLKAVKAILTPEQLEKFEAILEHLKERRQALDRFGPPPPGMGPPGLGPPPPPPGLGPPPPPPGDPLGLGRPPQPRPGLPPGDPLGQGRPHKPRPGLPPDDPLGLGRPQQPRPGLPPGGRQPLPAPPQNGMDPVPPRTEI